MMDITEEEYVEKLQGKDWEDWEGLESDISDDDLEMERAVYMRGVTSSSEEEGEKAAAKIKVDEASKNEENNNSETTKPPEDPPLRRRLKDHRPSGSGVDVEIYNRLPPEHLLLFGSYPENEIFSTSTCPICHRIFKTEWYLAHYELNHGQILTPEHSADEGESLHPKPDIPHDFEELSNSSSVSEPTQVGAVKYKIESASENGSSSSPPEEPTPSPSPFIVPTMKAPSGPSQENLPPSNRTPQGLLRSKGIVKSEPESERVVELKILEGDGDEESNNLLSFVEELPKLLAASAVGSNEGKNGRSGSGGEFGCVDVKPELSTLKPIGNTTGSENLLKELEKGGGKPTQTGGNKKRSANQIEPQRKVVPLKDRKFDPNIHCGVRVNEAPPCKRSLTCKTHSVAKRRAVEGRDQTFDILLASHKKAREAELKGHVVQQAQAPTPPPPQPPPPSNPQAHPQPVSSPLMSSPMGSMMTSSIAHLGSGITITIGRPLEPPASSNQAVVPPLKPSQPTTGATKPTSTAPPPVKPTEERLGLLGNLLKSRSSSSEAPQTTLIHHKPPPQPRGTNTRVVPSGYRPLPTIPLPMNLVPKPASTQASAFLSQMGGMDRGIPQNREPLSQFDPGRGHSLDRDMSGFRTDKASRDKLIKLLGLDNLNLMDDDELEDQLNRTLGLQGGSGGSDKLSSTVGTPETSPNDDWKRKRGNPGKNLGKKSGKNYFQLLPSPSLLTPRGFPPFVDNPLKFIPLDSTNELLYGPIGEKGSGESTYKRDKILRFRNLDPNDIPGGILRLKANAKAEEDAREIEGMDKVMSMPPATRKRKWGNKVNKIKINLGASRNNLSARDPKNVENERVEAIVSPPMTLVGEDGSGGGVGSGVDDFDLFKGPVLNDQELNNLLDVQFLE